MRLIPDSWGSALEEKWSDAARAAAAAARGLRRWGTPLPQRKLAARSAFAKARGERSIKRQEQFAFAPRPKKGRVSLLKRKRR